MKTNTTFLTTNSLTSTGAFFAKNNKKESSWIKTFQKQQKVEKKEKENTIFDLEQMPGKILWHVKNLD